MGVVKTGGTMLGGFTPICNSCGVHLCWDIAEEQYESERRFWDNWICQECNNGEPMTRKEWLKQIPAFSLRQSWFCILHSRVEPRIIGSGLSLKDACSLWKAGMLFQTPEEARDNLELLNRT